MAGKYGSASFAVFLADGYNLLADKVQAATIRLESIIAPAHGLGDAWNASLPVGVSRAILEQQGAFFDDTTNHTHDAFKASQSTSRIICVGPSGNVIARSFLGLEGAYGMAYDVLGQRAELTKANVVYRVTGQATYGVILQEHATRTQDWSTATEGTFVDSGASSSGGGVGFLQVSNVFGTFTGKIRHSDDGSNWFDLITFTSISASPAALRTTVSGIIKRYLCFEGTVWGTASPSASKSPSASASASPSASVSPSSSVSPSASDSPSKSPSLSASPSSSVSPSSSGSPSPSPSSQSGTYGTVTVFCGFCRT